MINNTDFINLKPTQRMRQMKVWVILVIFGCVFGVYAMTMWWHSLDPLVKEMGRVRAELTVAEYQLQKVENQLSDNATVEDKRKELRKRKSSLSREIKKLEEEFQKHYEECERTECQGGQFKLPDQSSLIKFVVTPAYAEENTQLGTKNINTKQNTVDKEFVFKIILIVLAIVYAFVNYKVWFSSNPRNMAVAIDTLKTITGFWIGLGTAAFGA